MAIKISYNDKATILEAVRKGEIDKADIAFPNLIDEIIIKMKQMGLIKSFANILGDMRKANASIPFEAVILLFIAAKMKIHSSLTDVPFAITDAGALAETGWNMWSSGRSLSSGLMVEGSVRNIVGKYDAEKLINGYNFFVQGTIFNDMKLAPTIHILDCTWVEVEIDNANYEKSEVTKEGGESGRGYKLATLRGICGDTGVLEEIKLGGIKEHDFSLSEEMVRQSPVFKHGDILINDRGFISREQLNYMKTERGVDTYIPLRKDMDAYEMAISVAKEQGRWAAHPNKKRKTQKIAFVDFMGDYWASEKPEEDVQFNACVVKDEATAGTEYEYRVFITTDTKATARQIIKTYELRPEIEEDYRQLKDFWQIENFKSTKYNFIVFHLVMVLVGYLFFQLFRLLPEGKPYVGKSLPVALKNYVPDGSRSVVCYRGVAFGIFEFVEFLDLYASVDADVKDRLRPVLAKA